MRDPADDSLTRSGAHAWKTRKRPGRTPRPSRRGESAARSRRGQGRGVQDRVGRRRGQVEDHAPGSQSFPLYRAARARRHRPAIPARGAGAILAWPQREPRRAGARRAHCDAQAPDAANRARPIPRRCWRGRARRSWRRRPTASSASGQKGGPRARVMATLPPEAAMEPGIRRQSGDRRHGLRAHQLRPRRPRNVGPNDRERASGGRAARASLPGSDGHRRARSAASSE